MTVYKSLVFMALVSLASCNKKGCDIPYGYEFVITAELSPKQDTVRIGDTIEVVSEFDDMVFEKNTGQDYHLQDFDFYPTTSLRRIDVYPTVSGLQSFTVVIDTLKYSYKRRLFTSGDEVLIGEYLYEEEKYTLKFFIVPQHTGLYYLSQNSLLVTGHGADQNFPEKCKNETVREILVYLNEGNDNNIDLLRHGADTAFNNRVLDDPQEKFYEEGAYVFYVTE